MDRQIITRRRHSVVSGGLLLKGPLNRTSQSAHGIYHKGQRHLKNGGGMTFREGTALRKGLTANQPSAGKPLTSVISCHFTFHPARRGRIKACDVKAARWEGTLCKWDQFVQLSVPLQLGTRRKQQHKWKRLLLGQVKQVCRFPLIKYWF